MGREVVKVLILDRGFIDGAQMGRLQQDYRIETILPVRANMDLYAEPRGRPAAAPTEPPQTWLGMGHGLLSWSQCPVPLTAVVNRERDRYGEVRDWVLAGLRAHPPRKYPCVSPLFRDSPRPCLHRAAGASPTV